MSLHRIRPQAINHNSLGRYQLAVFAVVLLALPPLSASLPAADIEITILHTNDLHQNLAPLPRIAGYVALYRRRDPHTLFIDAGDWFDRGSSLVTQTRGEALYGAMAKMNYDMWIVGNHDWAYGGSRLLELARRYPVPVLRSNLATTRPPLPSNFVSTIVKEIRGVRLGFFGITLDTYGKNPKSRPELYVLDCRESTAAAIAELKKADVDIIVAVTHLGFKKMAHEVGRSFHPSDIDLAKAYPDIDVIIGGHSHTRLEEPTVRQVYRDTGAIVTQAGALGQYIGRLTMTIDNKSRAIRGFDFETVKVAEGMPEHAATAEFIARQYQQHMPHAKQVIGEFKQPYEFHNLAFWYADFIRQKAHADICLLPRKTLYDEPKSFAAGKLDVERLSGYLYDRYIIRGTISGAELLRYCNAESRRDRFNPFHHQGRPFSGDAIFYSGFDVKFDTASRQVTFDIDPRKSYTLAIPWPFTRRDIGRYRHQLPPRDAAEQATPIPELAIRDIRVLPETSRELLIRDGVRHGLAFYRKFSQPRSDWEAWTKHFETEQQSKTDRQR